MQASLNNSEMPFPQGNATMVTGHGTRNSVGPMLTDPAGFEDWNLELQYLLMSEDYDEVF